MSKRASGMRGFTLLELLVAVTVSALLLTIGIPSFQRMVAENERSGYTADVYNALNLARSEAIARNVSAVVCKSSDATRCSASATWADGWIVYANNDNSLTGSEPSDIDEVIEVTRKLDRFTLTNSVSTFDTRVVFSPSGRASDQGEFVLCPDNAEYEGRKIVITSTGRPRTAPDTSCSNSESG